MMKSSMTREKALPTTMMKATKESEESEERIKRNKPGLQLKKKPKSEVESPSSAAENQRKKVMAQWTKMPMKMLRL